jgi:hypothetical protein
MAQITIYLPDDIEAEARKAAESEHTSVSRWIAGQISEKLSAKWPAAVRKAFGAFPDFPDADELRRGYGKDSPREPLD